MYCIFCEEKYRSLLRLESNFDSLGYEARALPTRPIDATAMDSLARVESSVLYRPSTVLCGI